MSAAVLGRGEAYRRYTARGSQMMFKAVAHTFGNTSATEARLLVIHTPAMDAYFAGLHELWNGDEPPTTEQERALMSRFGMEPA